MKKFFVSMSIDVNNKNINETDLQKYSKKVLYVLRLYNRFLDPIEIPKIDKLAIVLVDNSNKEHVIPSTPFTNVYAVYKLFPWDLFKNSTDELKFLLDQLLKIIEEYLTKEYNQNIELFIKAYEKTLEAGFSNEYLLSREKKSPNRKKTVQISVEENINFSTLLLNLKEIESNKVTKIDFFKINYMNTDEVKELTSNFKWLDNNVVEIKNKQKEIIFRIDVNVKKTDISFYPQIHTEEYLKDEIMLYNPATNIDKAKEILNKRLGGISSS